MMVQRGITLNQSRQETGVCARIGTEECTEVDSRCGVARTDDGVCREVGRAVVLTRLLSAASAGIGIGTARA